MVCCMVLFARLQQVLGFGVRLGGPVFFQREQRWKAYPMSTICYNHSHEELQMVRVVRLRFRTLQRTISHGDQRRYAVVHRRNAQRQRS